MEKAVLVKEPRNVIEVIDAIRKKLREERSSAGAAYRFYAGNPSAETDPGSAKEFLNMAKAYCAVEGETVLEVLRNYATKLEKLEVETLFGIKGIFYRLQGNRDDIPLDPQVAQIFEGMITEKLGFKVVKA